MRKILFYTLVIASLISTISCATIFTGTKDTLSFNSNPQGAKVYIDGIEIGKTPFTAKVKRSLSDKLAEFKLDGYKTRVITLDRKFNAVSIINLGSLVGWGIDAATGALMKYDKKGYDIELEKEKNISFENTKKIEINTNIKLVDVYRVEK